MSRKAYMISADMTISHVLSSHPELMPLFAGHGLGQFENKELPATLGPLLKLKSALSTAGVNAEPFLKLLNERIADKPRKGKESLLTRLRSAASRRWSH